MFEGELPATGDPRLEFNKAIDMVGKTISHFRILKKLSGGVIDLVYNAEDTRLKRNVALKFLIEELSRDQQALERFQG